MKKLLITGVGGFIASKIANSLDNSVYEIIGVDDLSNGNLKNIPKNLNFIKLDLSNKSSFKKLPSKIDTILHLAGQSSGEISFENPKLDLEKNTVSTLNLIEYGIKAKSNRIVYASSMSVYGQVPQKPIEEDFRTHPISCYGISKLASEQYLKTFKNELPFIGLRMFNVYGPGQDMLNLKQGMVSIYLAQAMQSGKIKVKGDLKRFRDFIFIDDVIKIWANSINNEKALNKFINVGTGEKTEVKTLLEKICKLIPGVEYFEIDKTPGDQAGIYASTKKMNNIFNIQNITSLDEGLRLFLNSFKRQPNL